MFASIQCEVKKKKEEEGKEKNVTCTFVYRKNAIKRSGKKSVVSAKRRWAAREREGGRARRNGKSWEGQPRNLAITRYFNLLRPSTIDASPRVAQRRRMS